MPRNITKADVRDLLTMFVAAIQLDQIQIDALPAKAFHSDYSDSMWRHLRRDHLEYFNMLLSTVEALNPDTLDRLTWIATNYEPGVVRERTIMLLGSAVSGPSVGEEMETATLFFDVLIEEVSTHPAGTLCGQDARVLMLQWLSVTDPLQIAEDPECEYMQHLGEYAVS